MIRSRLSRLMAWRPERTRRRDDATIPRLGWPPPDWPEPAYRPRLDREAGIILGILFVGIALLIVDAVHCHSRLRLLNTGTAVEGRVIRMKADDRHGTRIYYAPIVRFPLADGQDAEMAGPYVRSVNHPRGSVVRVLYPPGRPGEAVIDTPAWRWTAAWFMLAFGVALTTFGCFGLYHWRRPGWLLRIPGGRTPPALIKRVSST